MNVFGHWTGFRVVDRRARPEGSFPFICRKPEIDLVTRWKAAATQILIQPCRHLVGNAAHHNVRFLNPRSIVVPHGGLIGYQKLSQVLEKFRARQR
jgi:hypothetical protein